jgi:hypothetical protein
MRGCYGDSRVGGLDVDVLDPEAASAAGSVIRTYLHEHTGCGLDIPFRVGRAPKFTIPVRITEKVRKYAGRAFEVGGLRCQVEWNGEGSQFLIFGTHPSGKPYTWPLEGPEDIDPASLPKITPEQLNELMGLVEAKLAEFGTPIGGAHGGIRVGDEAEAQPLESLLAIDPLEAAAAAQGLQNADLDYDAWVYRAYAIYGALGSDGWQLWSLFSQRSKKYCPKTTRSVWRGVAKAAREGSLRSGWKALYGLAEADGWQRPAHPAQALLDKLAVGAEAQAEKPQLPVLPNFGPVRTDRDAALAEMQQEIADCVAAAVDRIALRRELEEVEEEARKDAKAAFLKELGKAAADLDRREKRRLTRRRSKAAKKAIKLYLALHGLEAKPEAEAVLFHGTQGGGKTRAIAQALARLEEGQHTVLVPTVAKAEELKEEIERHGPKLPVFAWRGRTHERADGTDRMCERDKELVSKAQAQGLNVSACVCRFCPLLETCAYIAQRDEVEEAAGNRIVIAAHETAFIPFEGLRASLVILDEEIISRCTRENEIEPSRILRKELWGKNEAEAATAKKVAAAMERYGEELAALREASVKEEELADCAAYLRDRHDEVIASIEIAIKEGVGERWIKTELKKLEEVGYRQLANFFSNIRLELTTSRKGANSVRLVFREKKIEGQDGKAAKERFPRYVVNRKRGVLFSSGTEMILLDGTGSPELNRLVFGDHVQESRYAVQRQGLTVQVVSNTNSKYRLLHRTEADRHRARLLQLIADLRTIYGDKLLVGCTMELERKLAEEGTLDGVTSMHFGAERGMNTAETCLAALVIGREQPSAHAIEGMARAFMVRDERTFESVLDQNEEGDLPTFRRCRRLRDGRELWAEVRSHPDPVARGFLELIREAAVVQMADRVRAVWSPKLIIIATSLPVDLDVELLVTEAELLRDVRAVAAISADLEGQGWSVVLNKVTKAQICKSILLQNQPLVTLFPVILPTRNGKGTEATLCTNLPVPLALRLAVEQHPGLRPVAPEGGVLAECLRRYGLVPSWAEVQWLLPEYLPDTIALKAAEDAERDEMKRLHSTLPTVRYHMPGKRGRPSMVAYDPSRVPDVERTLKALLGAGVRVEQPPLAAVAPDFMDPSTWAALPQGVILDEGEPPPFGFRGGPVQPLAYVIAGLFKIGDRLVVDVICQPPPPSVQEMAA